METLVVLNNRNQRFTRVHGKYVQVHTRVYERGTTRLVGRTSDEVIVLKLAIRDEHRKCDILA